MAQSPVESTVVFWNRVAALELADLKDKFTSNGWCTFADVANACSDFSGRDTNLFTEEVIKPLIGEDKKRIPKIRRLFAQAYAAHSNFIAKLDEPTSERAIQLHPLDREAALDAVRARMTGFGWDADTEPSFALTDNMATLLSSGKSSISLGRPTQAAPKRSTTWMLHQACGLSNARVPPSSSRFLPMKVQPTYRENSGGIWQCDAEGLPWRLRDLCPMIRTPSGMRP